MSSAAVGSDALRVAVVWNGALMVDEVLRGPRNVFLGEGPDSLFMLPEGLVPDDRIQILESTDRGFRLRLGSALSGSLWIGDERHSVAELARRESAVAVRPGDYGLVELGGITLFFQWVRGAGPPPRRLLRASADAAASFGLSVFVHVSLLVLLFMAGRQAPPYDPLQVDPDAVARYRVMVPEPAPPPDTTQDAAERGPETTREVRPSTTSGPRSRGRRSPVSHEVAAVRETGLLKALNQRSTQNAVAAMLALPSASDLVADTELVHFAEDDPPVDRAGAPAAAGVADLIRTEELGTEARPRRPPGPPEKRAEVRVREEAPTVAGSLSAAAVQSEIRRSRAGIRYCYEKELVRRPRLAGRIAVQFRIDAGGAVTHARVANSTLGDAGVEGCVVRQIRRLRFPAPGGEVVVTYPFVFGVGS